MQFHFITKILISLKIKERMRKVMTSVAIGTIGTIGTQQWNELTGILGNHHSHNPSIFVCCVHLMITLYSFFLSCVPVLKKSSHFNRCQIFGILSSFILRTDYISVRFIPHFPFHLKYILHVQWLKHLHTHILETVETETYRMIIFLYYVYAVGCLRQLPLYWNESSVRWLKCHGS